MMAGDASGATVYKFQREQQELHGNIGGMAVGTHGNVRQHSTSAIRMNVSCQPAVDGCDGI